MASKPIKKYLLFTSFFSIQLCYFSYNYIEAQTDFVQYFYTPSWKTSGSLYEPSQPSVKSSRFIRSLQNEPRETESYKNQSSLRYEKFDFSDNARSICPSLSDHVTKSR
ncbi:unnamed protein product [Acanthoscelides obtectus]|uniref:Uncharacterized protein n=2 Tax=Acanthoscelides obtectus TaxID=200917 RepID=A0A9P0Q4F0_ACAOB|nr:unnamed protein product [Acanthoscelides obtectus]CAK1687989.1 hypothetical protein AOBTE_LOCUS36499 [Acanthoscelides obtectus]